MFLTTFPAWTVVISVTGSFLSGRFLNLVLTIVCAFTIFFTPSFFRAFNLLHSFIHPLLSSSSLHRCSAAPLSALSHHRKALTYNAATPHHKATAPLPFSTEPLHRYTSWQSHRAAPLLPVTRSASRSDHTMSLATLSSLATPTNALLSAANDRTTLIIHMLKHANHF